MYLRNCLNLFWAHAKDLFPERQFFIRSRGRVRFLTLSDRQQIALVLVPLFALIGVFGMIGVNFWSQQYSIDLRDQKLALMEAENERLLGDRTELLAELTQSQTRFGIVTTELGQNQHAMTSLVRTQAELEHRVNKLKTELAQLNQEQTRYRVNQFALHRRFSQLREQLTRSSYLRDEPEGSLQHRPAEPQLAAGSVFASQADQPITSTRPKFELEFDATKRLLELTAAERDSAREQVRQQKHALEARMARLEGRLVGLQDMQDRLIAKIEIGTERHISELEKIIQLTGLDVDNLIERLDDRPDGIGGPLVGVAAPAKLLNRLPTPETHPEAFDTLEDRFDLALNRMGMRLARWSALSAVAERLPLAAPVDEYKVNSPYGKRRDPFTKRWARHDGADLTAKRRAPTLAAAPGVVTFAGWKGPYGRMIEIDHGFGLKTRYAHLYRVHIKNGEKVTKQQRIGVVGSSGRSTGRHLHYEVRFDDRTLDPLTFLKAGDHVFKNGQK